MGGGEGGRKERWEEEWEMRRKKRDTSESALWRNGPVSAGLGGLWEQESTGTEGAGAGVCIEAYFPPS